MQLPEKFLARMKSILGDEYERFLNSYSLPPQRAVRVNTLKISPQDFSAISPWPLEPSEMLREGYILPENAEHVGLHPYHMAGLYYVQEPSAMSVIEACDIRPGQKILDMCAAPGGKSGGIAARLNGTGVLVSNEVVYSRAKLLHDNIVRLGIGNCIVTSAYPDSFAALLPGYFDRVLVDAPCSGEGMFRKQPDAIAEWTPEHVASSAIRQKAILASASACVSPGGMLIYSTCTFSTDENEGVIDDFLKHNPWFSLISMKRLYPHCCKGEGHFVASMQRTHADAGQKRAASFACKLPRQAAQTVEALFDDIFISPPEGALHLVDDGRIMLMPFEAPQMIEKLRIICAGVAVGTLKNNRVKPEHALFMYSKSDTFTRSINLGTDGSRLVRYLSGNTLDVEQSLKGFCAVCADGYPVGFGKAVDGILKNHLPKKLTVPYYR